MAWKGNARSRSRQRRHYRWLHAGLIRDVRGVIHDIDYAFKRSMKGHRKIIYASDNKGEPFANYNAGELKRDMITWDSHYLQKVSHLLTEYGTWRRKQKMKGKKFLRDTLLETYQNRRFTDPYPNGKEDRLPGPPLNTVFLEDDFSGPMQSAQRFPRKHVLPHEKYYSGTNIPLSVAGIESDAWKGVHPRKPTALQVVQDFLTGTLAPSGQFGLHEERQLKGIESAFFELGWRVDRTALRQTNQDMKDRGISNAFRSSAWRRGPPIRVDKFKGNDIELLMKGMKNDCRFDRDEDGFDCSSEDDDDIEICGEYLLVPSRSSTSPAAGPSTERRMPNLGIWEEDLQS